MNATNVLEKPVGHDAALLTSLGLRPVINARGHSSLLGQAGLSDRVIEAMTAAARTFVPVVELQARASEMIASVTGAEAGCVGSGDAGCLFLATVACMVGHDVAAMQRLPDTRGLRNEVVIHRTHRNAYDHAVRATGAQLVEFGLPSGLSSAPFEWELRDAISPRTAAILYVPTRTARALPLPRVVQVARGFNVPVIVDGAGTVPPPENLRRYVTEGADLVTFSGGKGIRGPSAAGFLAGRRDLVLSATVQQQDMHVRTETWQGPLGTALAEVYPDPPLQGIGRMLKTGREEIVGLIVALQEFVERDHAAELRRWTTMCATLAARIDVAGGVSAVAQTDGLSSPLVFVRFHSPAEAARAFALLRDGEPRIYCHDRPLDESRLLLSPIEMSDAEVDMVARRFLEVSSLLARE